MDLTEAEDIKKSWQAYAEKLDKKDLHDPDNDDSVIDNSPRARHSGVCSRRHYYKKKKKANGGDGFQLQLSYFKS